jgi:hypothetical protein
MTQIDDPKPTPEEEAPRLHWPVKTAIEVIPIIMAMTALFTWGFAKRTTDVKLLTPLSTVTSALPWWGTVVMALVGLIGITGIIWATYLFSRAPMAPDGSDE